MNKRPEFENLPFGKDDDPAYSAWGLYGKDDQIGTLNLLTPKKVHQAMGEVHFGIQINLSLPLTMPRQPLNPTRKPLLRTKTNKGYANDDSIEINTQSSSHWDGLQHVGYHYLSKDKPVRFYNDLPLDKLGIDRMANRGGINSRGILLDYAKWSEDVLNQPVLPFTRQTISVNDLEAVLAWQNNTQIQPGDILLLRTGWTKAYHALSTNEQMELGLRQGEERKHIGVEQSKEMLKWHWDKALSAVATDTMAYEAWPPEPLNPKEQICLHEIFLSGWGMPIGETWDLEKLSEECWKKEKFSFLLISQPLNLPNGVASPSNAIAVL